MCCLSDWTYWFFSIAILFILATVTLSIIVNRMTINKQAKNDTVYEIALKRYARGEITKGQYDSFKNEISKGA